MVNNCCVRNCKTFWFPNTSLSFFRHVLPSIHPGYLKDLIPQEPPTDAEPWQTILKDVDEVIMPGMTHWASPNFHAYYQAANSYPAVIGDMMSAGLNTIGFSWIAGPVCTELEVVMMDWLGKMLGLPEIFLNSGKGTGGGIIQGSASESTLICLLAAKEKSVNYYQKLHPDMTEQDIKGKLIAYTSDQSNSSVEKSGLLGSMPMRLLPTDGNCSLRGETLKKAFEEDKKKGLIPCYVVGTLGTTGTCAFDDIEELGQVCKDENVWLHIDAAYAGAAFVCPEYQHYLKGVELAESFNFNPHKWMLVNFDCSAMWVKDANYLIDAFNVDRIYLQHQHEGKLPDYRHWQIPLGRKFRSLKIWFVLRSYGVKGIQQYIRKQIGLAKYFEKLVDSDNRFEVTTSCLGLVCFRAKGEDMISKSILQKVTDRKNIYMIPATCHGKLIIRFVIGSRMTEIHDIDYAWKEITTVADQVFAETKVDDKKVLSHTMDDQYQIEISPTDKKQ